jgi:hypothetical protein
MENNSEPNNQNEPNTSQNNGNPEPVQSQTPLPPLPQAAPISLAALPAPAAGQDLTTPDGILAQWPGAFKLYKPSKAAVMLNLAPILYIYAITLALNIVYTFATRNLKLTLPALALRIIYEIVVIILSAGIVYATIAGIRGKKVTLSDILNTVFKKALNIVAVSILMVIILLVSFVLLIIPVFFTMPRVVLALYFVLDQDLDPIEAIKASWECTKASEGKFYGILGVCLLIALPIITIIGILATIYFGLMYSAAFALFYAYLLNHKPPAIPQP